LNIADSVFPVFLLMFLGYGIKKLRLLRQEDTGVITTVIIYLTLPCFVFDAIYRHRTGLPPSIARVPIVGLCMIIVVLLAAYIIGRALKIDRPTLGGFILAAGFGNTGFLGYPVVQAAFGQNALITAALYDEIAMAFPLYTLGTFIAASFAGEKVDAKSILKLAAAPAVWIIPLALLVRPYNIPEPLTKTVQYLAAGTVPLAMLSLGLSLSARSIKGLVLPIIAACVLKLALLPAITFHAAQATGITGQVQTVMVLESGMPSAVMACVVASKFGANERFVAGVVFISTIMSIATIPLTLLILGAR
jgi:predicted permease